MINNSLKIKSPSFVYVMTSRIVTIEEEELQSLRSGRIPENTRRSTQFAVNLYNTWREEHARLGHRYAPLNCGVPSIINNMVAKFIVEIRKKDGHHYAPESCQTK